MTQELFREMNASNYNVPLPAMHKPATFLDRVSEVLRHACLLPKPYQKLSSPPNTGLTVQSC